MVDTGRRPGTGWPLAWSTALSTLAAVLVTSLPSAATAAPVRADADATGTPTRVLIVGDSITQGRSKSSPSGGYSWRYFLWKRLDDGVADFVGNKTGPAYSLSPSAQSPSLYADPAFDYDHSGVAGATLAAPDPDVGHYPIGTLVRRYQPDVIAALWGTNDLRKHTSADDLVALYTRWLLQARVQNPDVDVVIARLPWTWVSPETTRFNALLPRFAAAYSTARSRIVLAQMRGTYDRSDTYDDLHPVRSGEEKIAAMMASSLQALGLPVEAAPILPGNVFAPVRAPLAPSVVAARRGADVLVRWTARARATAYTVRCNGVDRTYRDGRTSTTIRSAVATVCRVRASNYAGSSVWSDPVRVAARRR